MSAAAGIRIAVSIPAGEAPAERAAWIHVGARELILSAATDPAAAAWTGAGVEVFELALSSWLTEPELAMLTAAPVDASAGVGAVVAALLCGLAEAPDPDGRHAALVAAAVRDLLAALAADRAEAAGDRLNAVEAAVLRVMRVIRARAGDLSFTARQAAEEAGLSQRAAQLAFQSTATTVSGFIRSLRSEQLGEKA
jgi:hypothetical protein